MRILLLIFALISAIVVSSAYAQATPLTILTSLTSSCSNRTASLAPPISVLWTCQTDIIAIEDSSNSFLSCHIPTEAAYSNSKLVSGGYDLVSFSTFATCRRSGNKFGVSGSSVVTEYFSQSTTSYLGLVPAKIFFRPGVDLGRTAMCFTPIVGSYNYPVACALLTVSKIY